LFLNRAWYLSAGFGVRSEVNMLVRPKSAESYRQHSTRDRNYLMANSTNSEDKSG